MGFFDIFRPREVAGERSVRLRPIAAMAGDLRSASGLSSCGGEFVVPFDHPGSDPVAWYSQGTGDQTNRWAKLVKAFPRTGLWPMIAESLPGEAARPWLHGEFGGPQDEPAYAPVREADVTLTATGVENVLLVPVTRPADVPWRLGWFGPVNHDLTGADVSSRLRDWEARYGAILTNIGFDTIELQVAAPPSDPDEVRAVAEEHYAFCPDIIDQGAGTLEAYLPAVSGDHWYFWWD